MTETSEWIWQCGHAQSVRPGEYVRMGWVQPDSAEPIERYELDTDKAGHNPGEPVPVLVNKWTGEREAPPRTIPIARGSADNPIALEPAVFELDGNRQEIYVSRRAGIVCRWKTKLAAPSTFDGDLIANPVWGAGLGQELGCAVFTGEQLNTPGWMGTNLNYGGAVRLGFDIQNPIQADEVNVPSSPLLHLKITDSYVESCVIPFHFLDGERQSQSYSPHGMDETHSALMWRHRAYQRVTPNWGGDPYVHLLTTLFYTPEDWDDTLFAHLSEATREQHTPFTLYGVAFAGSAPFIIHGLGLDEGYFADLEDDTELRSLDGWPDPSIVFNDDGWHTWAFTPTGMSYINSDTGQGFSVLEPQFPSGYNTLLHARSTDGFAIGVATKLGPAALLLALDGERAIKSTQASITTGLTVLDNPAENPPSELEIEPPWLPGHPYYQHIATKGCGAQTSAVTWLAGWSGIHSLMYVGPLDEAHARLKAARKILDVIPDPMEYVPSVGRAGTDMADDEQRVATPLERLKVTRRTTFGSRLR
jgi:hypothetical protein